MSRGRGGLEGKKRAPGDAAEVTRTEVASILTPSREQNELFASEVAAWRAAYGAAALAVVHREDLRVALRETRAR